MAALTATIVGAGRYVMHRGELRRVPMGSVAITCQACEWTVYVPRSDLDYAESLRREHLGTAHLSGLISGAIVLDPELAQLSKEAPRR